MNYLNRYIQFAGLILVLFFVFFTNSFNATNASLYNNNLHANHQEQKSIGAWMPYWDLKNVSKSYKAGKNLLNEIAPFWYYAQANGKITKAGKIDLSIVSEAKKANIEVIPMISNSYNGVLISKIINNKKLNQIHINELVKTVKKNNFDGIELDYEGLLEKDRNKYSNFVSALAKKLHASKKLLVVTLQAKTKEPGSSGSTKAQDWQKLSEYADKVHIMAYDYHWKTSPPGPIAPINWIEKIAKFAQGSIPAGKAYLGVGTYGYDWRNGRAKPITLPQARALSKKYKTRVMRDNKSKELYLRLKKGQKAPIWIQDSGSLKLKIDVIKKYNLAGVFIWRLGNEDSRHWSTLQTELR